MSIAVFLETVALALSIAQPTALSSNEPADCMARNIWFEARGSSFADKVAVAHVVMNRVNASVYPDDVCAVIYQDSQFSWTVDGKSDKVVIKNSIDETAWADTKLATQLVMSGKTPDLTGGATHYHADYVNPGWSARMSANASFGAHIYYQNVLPAAGR